MSKWASKPADGWPDGLILYDGVCGFCARWVRMVIARDEARMFRFVPIQSSIGRDMAEAFAIDAAAPETNAVVLDGRVWMKSDAAIAVMSHLPGLRRIGLLRLIPKPLRDAGYDLIARNRYALFGKSDACPMPTEEERDRFIDGPTPRGP